MKNLKTIGKLDTLGEMVKEIEIFNKQSNTSNMTKRDWIDFLDTLAEENDYRWTGIEIQLMAGFLNTSSGQYEES